MALVRETVYAALFTKVSAIAGLVKKGRNVVSVSDVDNGDFPALFMAQTHQRPTYEAGKQVIWELGADIYIYTKAKGGLVAGQIMNPLVDGLQLALAFDNLMNNACTLGGVALKCEMGDIDTDEGTMGEFSIIRCPVTITVRN